MSRERESYGMGKETGKKLKPYLYIAGGVVFLINPLLGVVALAGGSAFYYLNKRKK